MCTLCEGDLIWTVAQPPTGADDEGADAGAEGLGDAVGGWFCTKA